MKAKGAFQIQLEKNEWLFWIFNNVIGSCKVQGTEMVKKPIIILQMNRW